MKSINTTVLNTEEYLLKGLVSCTYNLLMVNQGQPLYTFGALWLLYAQFGLNLVTIWVNFKLCVIVVFDFS